MFAESAGMKNVAIAICGLPRAFSHDSSYAFQMSVPKNGNCARMPIASRAAARGIGKSSDASYCSL